jgi:Flp pilus assembly protein TadG
MPARRRSRRSGEHGQVLVLFTLGLIALIAGVALVVDGGTAFAQQRAVQNGADAAANAGATVLAVRLGGTPKTDADVQTAIGSVAGLNGISEAAYYTNVTGAPLDVLGAVVAEDAAAPVGGSTIPPGAQGVHVRGDRTFGTTFAGVLGFTSFTAGADAVAVTGSLIGGQFLPVVFPVNITDCAGNGDLGTGQQDWDMSDPAEYPNHPVAADTNNDGVATGEYIVPLCKTDGGSFMVLDLDGISNNCDYEVLHPTHVQWASFPVDVASDNGNNCAKQMEDAVNSLNYAQPGSGPVLIPICDDNACNTSGGSHATYHITGVAAFVIDYMSDENNPNNSLCQSHYNDEGRWLQTISGNGSSSCIAGWFVRFVTKGPVGSGEVLNADAIGIQLIK